jgi:hypothetical protein
MQFKNKIRKLFIVLSVATIAACGGGGSSEPENLIPSVSVSSISITEKEPVTLSATARDSDGTIQSYSWTQVSGTPVTFTGGNTNTISFTAPNIDVDETLSFTVRATDDDNGVGSTTGNVSVAHIPKTLSVSVQDMEEIYTLNDGESFTLNLDINNTTDEELQLATQESNTDDESFSVSLDGDSLTLVVNELTYSMDSEVVLYPIIELTAGEKTVAINLNVSVTNDEFKSFQDKEILFFNSRQDLNPLSELQSVERRFLMQANILGIISNNEYDNLFVAGNQRREEMHLRALELTQAINDKWVRVLPSTDEEALEAVEDFIEGVAILKDIYTEFYVNSKIDAYDNEELGLPEIFLPNATFIPRVGFTSNYYGSLSYGDFVDGQYGEEFVFKDEYKFLGQLTAFDFCGANAPSSTSKQGL